MTRNQSREGTYNLFSSTVKPVDLKTTSINNTDLWLTTFMITKDTRSLAVSPRVLETDRLSPNHKGFGDANLALFCTALVMYVAMHIQG